MTTQVPFTSWMSVGSPHDNSKFPFLHEAVGLTHSNPHHSERPAYVAPGNQTNPCISSPKKAWNFWTQEGEPITSLLKILLLYVGGGLLAATTAPGRKRSKGKRTRKCCRHNTALAAVTRRKLHRKRDRKKQERMRRRMNACTSSSYRQASSLKEARKCGRRRLPAAKLAYRRRARRVRLRRQLPGLKPSTQETDTTPQ